MIGILITTDHFIHDLKVLPSAKKLGEARFLDWAAVADFYLKSCCEADSNKMYWKSTSTDGLRDTGVPMSAVSWSLCPKLKKVLTPTLWFVLQGDVRSVCTCVRVVHSQSKNLECHIFGFSCCVEAACSRHNFWDFILCKTPLLKFIVAEVGFKLYLENVLNRIGKILRIVGSPAPPKMSYCYLVPEYV